MICNDLKRPANQPIDPERCPLCGHPNNCQRCAPGACQGRCWCVELEFPAELLARVPEEFRNRACICRSCVEKFRWEKERGDARNGRTGAAEAFSMTAQRAKSV